MSARYQPPGYAGAYGGLSMKNVIFLAIASLTLASCANWTPEQREAYIAQMRANAPAQDAQRQQAQQQLYQQQMQAIQAWGANNRANAPTNCLTTYVGQTAYTNCH